MATRIPGFAPPRCRERDNIRSFWEEMKVQEQENIRRLKELVAQEIQNGCF